MVMVTVTVTATVTAVRKRKNKEQRAVPSVLFVLYVILMDHTVIKRVSDCFDIGIYA